MKRQSKEWGKYLQIIPDKTLVSRIYKELQCSNKNINDPTPKWAQDVNRHFFKEHIQIVNKHMKRCSISFVIGEMQIKTIVGYHFAPTRTVIIKKTYKASGQDDKVSKCYACHLP